MAMYPETTAFYPAVVEAPPAMPRPSGVEDGQGPEERCVAVFFEDDEPDEETGLDVPRVIPDGIPCASSCGGTPGPQIERESERGGRGRGRGVCVIFVLRGFSLEICQKFPSSVLGPPSALGGSL